MFKYCGNIWQWDSNIELITTLPDTMFVHFSRGTDIYSLHPSGGKVAIPNILLQESGFFDVYAYVMGEDGNKTLHKASFDVFSRPMPPDYIYEPTPVITYPELVDLVNEMRDIAADYRARLSYSSMERIAPYLYQVTFDSIPEYDPSIDAVPSACSTYVSDGKMYRNLDLGYSEMADCKIVCKNFVGMAAIHGLNDGNMEDSLVGQLPYHVVDGINTSGIMISTHVLFNDFDYAGTGNTPMTLLPYLILTNVKSMDALADDIGDCIADLIQTPALVEADYLLQYIVTDGTTTMAIVPGDSGYSIIDITANPKLTNFRWVEDETVTRADLQERPVGVERWNLIPCDLSDLKYTNAYESPGWLSEFIGINGTTKDSTDAELEAVYELAHAAYIDRERDGVTWQTVHSVVYSASGIDHLHIQENWDDDYSGKSGGGEGTSDHRDLTHRSDANQHPMTAITGLSDALDSKADASDIPTKTSDLTNDSGFLTEHQSLAEYAKKTEIPTMVSQLTNDAGYLTLTTLPIYDGGLE